MKVQSSILNLIQDKIQNCGISLFWILIFAFCIFIFSPIQTSGKSKEEELKRFQEKIKEEKRKVKKVEKKEKSVLSELEVIENALKEKEEEFKVYDNRLKETEKIIKKTEEEITLLHKMIAEEKNHLSRRFRDLYKQRRRGYYYGILIGSKDIFRRYKYLKVMADQDRRLIDNYMENSIKLKGNMLALERLRGELSSYREKVKKKEGEIKIERNKKLNLLNSLRTEKSTRESLIQELEEAARRVEALIKEADKRVELPSIPGIGFAGQKGRLPWPSEGRLLALFGKQMDPEFNTPVFKRGIEIRTQPGNDIKVIYKGSVVYADWFKGYGKLLIINHGDRYYSLYAHASEVFPKIGEVVSEGQVVGKVGDTGSFKGPILYFEIRHKGEPVDPLVWLRKR